MDRELLAYLGGCIDCDGFITISVRNRRRADGTPNRHYIAVLGLGQITTLIPELFKQTFGGTIAHYVYVDRPNSQTAHNWQVSNARAKVALEALRPFIRLKAKQADIALQFIARVDSNTFGRALVPGESEAREGLRQRIVALNHGKRRLRETA